MGFASLYPSCKKYAYPDVARYVSLIPRYGLNAVKLPEPFSILNFCARV
jgi:hypothetical protein